MRPIGIRTEDLLLASWNAVGVPLHLVSAALGIGWLAAVAGRRMR